MAERESLHQFLLEKARDAEGNALKCKRDCEFDLVPYFEGLAQGFRESADWALSGLPVKA